MNNTYKCNICKYTSINKQNFNSHCKTKEHLMKEEILKQCVLCDKSFKNKQIYSQHKKQKHSNNKNNINISNNTELINNLLNNNNLNLININLDMMNKNIVESNKEIIESNKEIKDEIVEVKTSVNKAITKASSLIKYLMEKYPSVPPIKKITDKKCIDTLRIDFNCPYIQTDKYILEKQIIYKHANNKLINILYKSILNLVNHKNPEKQSIYNTDYTRHNYIIKTNKIWDEDLAGVRFTDYIIKPLLKTIGELVKEYRLNELEPVNMRKNTLQENQIHFEQLGNTLSLECDIYNDKLINPLLKKLSPYLRYLENEIEDIEKFDEIKKIQEELENIIKNNNEDEEDDEYDEYDNDEAENDNYIKKIKVRLI